MRFVCQSPVYFTSHFSNLGLSWSIPCPSPARCKADEVVQDVVERIQSGAQRCVAGEPMNTFGLNGMVLKCQPDRQQSQTTSANVACMRVTEDDHPTSWRVRLMFFSLPYSFTKRTAIFNSEHDSIKG